MKFLLSFLLLMLAFIPQQGMAQNSDVKKEQITKVINDYFHLDRENIHVQIDKKVFMTNEQIWFKGYVFHRKLNMPFFATTNIYATLLDSEGKEITSQLLCGNIGSFTGSFTLGDKLSSGKYYLQFYTNWMNNFAEDESSVYEVTVINPEQGAATALARPDNSQININLRPEGGILLQEVTNSVAINITDCLNNTLPVTKADIVNSKGDIVKSVQINKLGFGRFDLPAGNTNGYKAVVMLNGHRHEQLLPQAQLQGVSIEVNNYAMADKLIAKIKTNATTNSVYAGQPLYLVVQQDEKSVVLEFSFTGGKTEQTIVVPQAELFNGVNTLRVLDPNLNQIAERLVYKHPNTTLSAQILQKKDTPENIEVSAKIPYPTMNVSVTVLPESTASIDNTSDIYGSFLIQPYIDRVERIAARYYLDGFSRSKHYELDLFLASQQSKYKWKDMQQKVPVSTYPFDMGLALKPQ